MVDLALPIAVALFAWWFGTGAVLWLSRLPSAHRTAAMAGSALIGVVATIVIWRLGSQSDMAGAYLGFSAGLALWAVHEFSFLTGMVTGPRRSPCPPGLSGWARFRAATETVIHHEVALFLTVILLFALTWGADNMVGAMTFALLWVMRISAKLNVFLGVSNLEESFLPEPIAYLKTYFGHRRMNALMVPSIIGGCIALALIIAEAITSPSAFEATAMVLLATMLALAVLEHVLLVLPLPDAVLWRWALPQAERASLQTTSAVRPSKRSGPPASLLATTPIGISRKEQDQ